jgi:3-methylfumaryl-CoA hydratase
MEETQELQAWIGRTQSAEDEVTRPTALRLAAMLDRPPAGLERGAPLPQAWYAVLFPAVAPQSEIGADGHPRKGDFLPPVPLPRRMFAGRRVRFSAPLHIGDAVERVSEISRIEPKQGRSGRMVFVTVIHRISTGGRLAITEEQDIVYREAATPGAAAPASTPADMPQAAWSRPLTPDPVLVFRYSALTFNGHRIHYDADYTRGTEGYPGLVVNGGLSLLLLLDLAETQLGRPFASVAVRNLKPLFVDRPLTLCGAPSADGRTADLWTLDAAGEMATRASLELAP